MRLLLSTSSIAHFLTGSGIILARNVSANAYKRMYYQPYMLRGLPDFRERPLLIEKHMTYRTLSYSFQSTAC